MNDLSQYLIIIGTIAIILMSIYVFKDKQIRMKSHHKIQVVALMGLTLIAIIALIVSLSFSDNLTSFIAVASAAVGGIAGFLSHKMTTPNNTLLSPIDDKLAKVGTALIFSIAGVSTSGYNLNYSMLFSPALPDGEDAKLNPTTGEFSWTPKAQDEDQKEYTVTFTVTDGMGGTDSRTMKIIVKKE